MAESPTQLFNPCSLDENDQIPAKIWELMRRNVEFRNVVRRLSVLDAKERNDYRQTGKYHGTAWNKSWRLVERVAEQHLFAGVALKWLVPEPLFHCSIAVWPLGKKWRSRPAFPVRFSQIGVGTTPNVGDKKNWSWRNPNRQHHSGHSIVRGPEVHWTTSRFKRLRSWVNPILEWRRYPWPFTVEHAWLEAPAGFKREFQFIWRNRFDSRPANPLTQDRRDAPAPHEVTFFHDWNLMKFQASGQLTQDDLYQVIRFKEIADHYRVFAIPQTILTKGAADAVGRWLAAELKRGSNLFGPLLKDELLDEGELLGLNSEWNDWLASETNQAFGSHKSAYFYKRCDYMKSLVSRIYPQFNLAALLAKPKHRARGKKYNRKTRND